MILALTTRTTFSLASTLALPIAFALTSNAFAQSIPDLIGVYEGSSSITLWGCTNPADNQTTVASGSVEITQQTGASFVGQATFTATSGGRTVSEQLALNGNANTSGSLSGSAVSQGSVDGSPSGSGQAAFTGQFASGELSIQFPGGPVGIGNCVHGGARISGARCGNGTVDAGEQCDDDNRDSEDGCSSACVTEFCGDSIVQAGLGEQCDDGGNPAPACDDSCLIAVPEPRSVLTTIAGAALLSALNRRRAGFQPASPRSAARRRWIQRR